MYTINELADKYGVSIDLMYIWLKQSKARHEDGRYAVVDLVTWHDTHNMS